MILKTIQTVCLSGFILFNLANLLDLYKHFLKIVLREWIIVVFLKTKRKL